MEESTGRSRSESVIDLPRAMPQQDIFSRAANAAIAGFVRGEEACLAQTPHPIRLPTAEQYSNLQAGEEYFNYVSSLKGGGEKFASSEIVHKEAARLQQQIPNMPLTSFVQRGLLGIATQNVIDKKCTEALERMKADANAQSSSATISPLPAVTGQNPINDTRLTRTLSFGKGTSGRGYN